MKFILSPKKVNYLISIEFIQLFNILQINFGNQPSLLFNILSQNLILLVRYQAVFQLFEPTLHTQHLQRIKFLKKSKKTVNLKSKYTRISTTYRSNPFSTNLPSPHYNLHKYFNKFKKFFVNPPFPLFNPIIRARRRQYGALNQQTSFKKKLKMHRMRRKSKYRKQRNLRFWWRNLRKFWHKLLVKSTLPKQFLIKTLFRKKGFKVKALSKLHNQLFLKTISQLSFYKLIPLLNNSSTVLSKNKQPLITLLLTSYFTRFRKFIQGRTLSKHLTGKFSKRLDLWPSSKYTPLLKTRKKLKLVTIGTPHLSLPPKNFVKSSLKSQEFRLSTTLPLVESPASIRTFIFRKQLTNCIYDFIETQRLDPLKKSPLTLKFRLKNRRKKTKLDRVRLPRTLHFRFPYRAKLKRFYSYPTYFYLMQRTRRRVKRHRKVKNKAYRLNYSLNKLTNNTKIRPITTKIAGYPKPWPVLIKSFYIKSLDLLCHTPLLKKRGKIKRKKYRARKIVFKSKLVKLLKLRKSLKQRFVVKKRLIFGPVIRFKQARKLKKRKIKRLLKKRKWFLFTPTYQRLSIINSFFSLKLTLNSYQVGLRRLWSNWKLNWKLFQAIKVNKPCKLHFKARGSQFSNLTAKLVFKPLRALPFILSTIGFIYTSLFSKSTPSKALAYIKRIKYSFFKVYDIKRYILKARSGRAFLRRKVFKKKRVLNFKSMLPTTTQETIFSKLITYRHTNLMNSNIAALPAISEDIKIFQGISLNSYDDYGLRIKRIKFKPGYSRMWRTARSSLNQVLGLKFRYQHRLTTYLSRFAQLSSSVQSKLIDLKLKNLLIRSRFVFDSNTALSLLESKLVYVNGHLVTNPSLLLFMGDVIQIIIQFKFYVVYRWLLNWYSFKSQRRSRLSRSKFKKLSHAQTKQRSHVLPDWVLRMRSTDKDISKFIEVDFFTLSSFVIYNPSFKNDVELLDLLDSRVEIFNMYNWKYIN